jgi:hypothetical protein
LKTNLLHKDNESDSSIGLGVVLSRFCAADGILLAGEVL